MCDDHLVPVILDNGSWMFKAGFAGDNAPKVEVPCVVGRLRLPGFDLLKNKSDIDKETYVKEIYVGSEAERRRGILILKYPIERGVITHWNELQMLWDYTFSNELKVSPKEHSVLMTEAPLTPKSDREKITEIMFESFGTPALYVAARAVLSLYASGHNTGVVLHSGQWTTCSVPVYEGHILPHAVGRMDLGGRDLTEYLKKLLLDKDVNLTNASYDYKYVRDIKEELCYVANYFQKEMIKPESTLTKPYYDEDSGRDLINISTERFKCPEILFQPNLARYEFPGIHEIAHRSICKCNEDIQKELYANVILSGGNTMYPGFDERMTRDLTALAPPDTTVKVIAPPNSKQSAWIGGSMLASLPSFHEMCITKDEYEEYGPTLVHMKCF